MRELLPLLSKPSHYLGCEPGSVHKDPAAVRCRLGLAFPDLYEVGMSYTGQALLYHAVNSHPGLWAERVFAPALDAAALLTERKAPLCTMESDTPLARLDALGFHITHELCYTNVLYMLDLAGIPARAAERLQAPPGSWPVVMAGGGCAFNAEPLAPFMDLMVLGDGEEILPELLERIAEGRQAGLPLDELLAGLRHIPGVYIPSLFEATPQGLRPLLQDYPQVEKRLAQGLDALPYPPRPPQPFGAVHNRYTIEIARGCTRGCRFCHAGMVYRPVRERSLGRLDEIMQQGLSQSGYGELSFLSLSAGDFSALSGLFAQSIARCRAEQVSVSLPSLRVGSVGPEIMEQIASIRRTGATLAPEAGSQRLRDVINKGIDEEELLRHAALLFANGWRSLKLYFMIGLPSETREDLQAIFDLCRQVVEAAKRAGAGKGRLQVTAAISPFVPKPHTPFQWERQIGLEETRERIAFLRELFRKDKRLNLRWHLPEMSWLEGIFSRAGRELADVVERAWQRGALFSSWNDHLDIGVWRQVLEECGFDQATQEGFLAARDLDAPLPWEHLNCGVDKRFLLTERRRALETKLTPDCRFGDCRGCGVCNHQGRRSSLTRQAAHLEIAPVCNLGARDQARQAAPVPPDAAEAPQRPTVEQRNLHAKAAHLRLWYAKQGVAAYLSQLELQDIFERALRRGGLPLSFSQGYHPLPLLSFCRALPVGVHSRCEYLDMFLREPQDAATLCDLLQAALPQGVECLEAEELPMQGRQPQSCAEEYLLSLHGGDEAVFIQAWRDFAARDSLIWARETKKGPRSHDIRPLFARMEETRDQTGAVAVRLLMDWREAYLSPLKMCQLVLPDIDPCLLRLEKLRQLFPDPQRPGALPV